MLLTRWNLCLLFCGFVLGGIGMEIAQAEPSDAAHSADATETTAASQAVSPAAVDFAQWIEQAEAALQQDPHDLDALLKLGQAHYYLSIFMEKKASQKANKAALAALAPVLQQRPDDPIVLAYVGSSELIQARHAWAVWDKSKFAKAGLQKLQHAGELAPDHLHVLAVRGVATSYLPDFFDYQEKAQADLEAVAPHVEQAWQDEIITANLASAVLYHHGKWLEKSADTAGAIAAYQRAIAITTESHTSQEAQAALKRLGQ